MLPEPTAGGSKTRNARFGTPQPRGFKSLPSAPTCKPHGYAVYRQSVQSVEAIAVARIGDVMVPEWRTAAAVFLTVASQAQRVLHRDRREAKARAPTAAVPLWHRFSECA